VEDIQKQFNETQILELDKIIDEFGKKPGGLIPLLEEAQILLGYLPLSVQYRISLKTGIAPNKIYGVITFYSFFSMEQKARHRVQVCMGTACYVKGGKDIAEKVESLLNIKKGESTPDKRYTYENARCFGACGLAPVVIIDGKVYGKVTVDSIEDILVQYK